MKKIKQFLFNHFEQLFPIFTVTAIGLFLLMIRLKLTLSFFYLFLVWNLFLAWVPLVVSFYLSRKKIGKPKLLLGSLVWLLFLPNAPYILTDFIHLNHYKSLPIFDGFMLTVFSIAGLVCYLISVHKMERLWNVHSSKKVIRIFLFMLPFATGFGIYLGRFLRWNSWDIVQQPMVLLKDIAKIIIFPGQHGLAWGTTLAFGILLWFLYQFFKKRELYN